MKALVISFLFLAVVGMLMFKAGWLTPQDPKLALKNIQTNVTPGLTWQQVVDIHSPRKVTPLPHPLSDAAASPIDFKPALHEQWLKDDKYPHGFTFEYHFSQSDAIAIVFDNTGQVTYIHDVATVGDLFR